MGGGGSRKLEGVPHNLGWGGSPIRAESGCGGDSGFGGGLKWGCGLWGGGVCPYGGGL